MPRVPIVTAAFSGTQWRGGASAPGGLSRAVTATLPGANAPRSRMISTLTADCGTDSTQNYLSHPAFPDDAWMMIDQLAEDAWPG